MNILIIVILITIFVAGAGALIYVFVFRARHKKEVLENSQYNNVPSFGGDMSGATQGQSQQPMGSMFDTPADQGPVSQNANGGNVMNDITQGTPQPGISQDAPLEPSESPVSPPSDITEPTVNHGFPSATPPAPEAPLGDITQDTGNVVQEPIASSDDKNLGQSSFNETNNILNDTAETGSVADIVNEKEEIATDSSVEDSNVPVTEDAAAPMSEPSAEVSQPSSAPTGNETVPENVGDSYTIPSETSPAPMADTSALAGNMSDGVAAQGPMPTPETPVAPSVSADTAAPATPEPPVVPSAQADNLAQPTPNIPTPPPEDDAPPQGGTDDAQSGGAKEMHI